MTTSLRKVFKIFFVFFYPRTVLFEVWLRCDVCTGSGILTLEMTGTPTSVNQTAIILHQYQPNSDVGGSLT